MKLLGDNRGTFVRGMIGMLYMRTLFFFCCIHAPTYFFDAPFPDTAMSQTLHCCMRAYGTLQDIASKYARDCDDYAHKTQQYFKELKLLLSAVHAFNSNDRSIKLDDLEYLLVLIERMGAIVTERCGNSLLDTKCDFLLRIITKNIELICLNIKYSQATNAS